MTTKTSPTSPTSPDHTKDTFVWIRSRMAAWTPEMLRAVIETALENGTITARQAAELESRIP